MSKRGNMNKPPFDPNQPFEEVDAKPPFDPSQPFQEVSDQPEQRGDLLQRSAQAIRGVESKVGEFLRPAVDAVQPYMKSQVWSPQDMLGRVDNTVRQGFNKAGQFAAEQMGREGANPHLAASVGTFTQMAPDIASLIGPEGGVPKPRRILRPVSTPLMERGLGFTQGFRRTAPARRAAKVAATVALDNDIMPLTGNPEVAFDRATAFGNREGSGLGSMRESVGPKPVDRVIQALEDYRARRLQGARGGKSDILHNKIDEAIETVRGLSGQRDPNALVLGSSASEPGVSVNRMAQTKRDFPANYQTDAITQEANKGIKGSIEEGIENILRESGVDMSLYKSRKRNYGASELMREGLNPEIARQGGNNMMSLPTAVLGAGTAAATGNPVKAAAQMGLWEGVRRRGAGIAARAVEGVDRNIVPQLAPGKWGQRAMPFAGRRILKATKRPVLTDDQVRDFLVKAKNDPKKARQMAIDAGFEVPE